MFGQEIVLADAQATSVGIAHTAFALSRIDEAGYYTSECVECSGTASPEMEKNEDAILSTQGKRPDKKDPPRSKPQKRFTYIIVVLLAMAVAITAFLFVLLVSHLTDSSTRQTHIQVPQLASRDVDPQGSPQPIRGEPPPAIVFPDGSVDYLYASSSTARDIGTGDFTMSVHLMGTEGFPQAQHPIFLSNRRGSSQGSGSFLFGLHAQWADSANKIPYMRIGKTNWIDYPDQPQVLDGSWHHLVARRKGTTLSYFVDGVPVADLTAPAIGSTIGSSYPTDVDQKLVIGYDLVNPSATRFFGKLEELSIWNRALPIRDIATGLRSLDGAEAGLLAYFGSIPLEEFGEISSHAKSKPVAADKTDNQLESHPTKDAAQVEPVWP